MDSASYRTISAKPKHVTAVTMNARRQRSHQMPGLELPAPLLIAARFVRAGPEAGTILRRRQILVADRHRRVRM
jgi:hypothetical protein